MNRQTILASIHRQLRESFAETGEERPLGELVVRVAEEIRSGMPVPMGDATATVVPIEKVASFVDGHVDVAEADSICEAVMVDNSVLAELIAAVRAMQVPGDQLPPLSPALAAKLHAMSSTNLVLRDSSQSDAKADWLDHRRQDVPEIVVQPAIEPASENRKPQLGNWRGIAAGLLAIAATIVVAIVLLGRGDDRNPSDSMVVDAGDAAIKPPSLPGEIPDVATELPDAPEDPTHRIVESETPMPPASVDPQILAPEPDQVLEPKQPNIEAIVQDDAPAKVTMPIPREENPLNTPDPIRISEAAAKLADFKWTEVSGLLTERNEPSAEPSSRQRAITWKRVQQGAVSSASSTGSAEQTRVAIRTLPFSRASGEFATGGRIVVAADTGLEIDRAVTDASAQFNLMHGSIAMMDIDEGTLVKLQAGAESIATLRWMSKASAVVHRQATGLQIQVDGGPIEVNDQVVNEESVQVREDRTVETIRAPKRLPRWITRPDETTAAERMILAQIANTDDVTSALTQKINSLSAADRLNRDEQLTLAKLANWHAAMAGTNLYRLTNSRVAALRLAGLQRLAQMPETDPRYQRTWNAIERAMNNPQHFLQIRGWFQMLRTGTRPNMAQIELMLAGLSSRDFAGRVISDFLLRQYVRNPPPFDPAWTGQTLQRAVNVYRERAGLPIDRTRPNAAVGNVR